MFLFWSCVVLKLWLQFNSNGCEIKTKSKLNYYHQGWIIWLSLEVILTLLIFKLMLIGVEMILTAYRIVKSLALSAGLLNVTVLVVFCLLVWFFFKCILPDLNRICGLSQLLFLFHTRFSSLLGNVREISLRWLDLQPGVSCQSQTLQMQNAVVHEWFSERSHP